MIAGTTKIHERYEHYWVNYIGTMGKKSDFLINDYSKDIALVHVKRPISFNDAVKSIPLQTEKFDDVNAQAVMTGWGGLKVNFTLISYWEARIYMIKLLYYD